MWHQRGQKKDASGHPTLTVQVVIGEGKKKEKKRGTSAIAADPQKPFGSHKGKKKWKRAEKGKGEGRALTRWRLHYKSNRKKKKSWEPSEEKRKKREDDNIRERLSDHFSRKKRRETSCEKKKKKKGSGIRRTYNPPHVRVGGKNPRNPQGKKKKGRERRPCNHYSAF